VKISGHGEKRRLWALLSTSRLVVSSNVYDGIGDLIAHSGDTGPGGGHGRLLRNDTDKICGFWILLVGFTGSGIEGAMVLRPFKTLFGRWGMVPIGWEFSGLFRNSHVPGYLGSNVEYA
jgi:hypothetical protein